MPDANTNAYIAVGDPNNQPVIDGFVSPFVGLTQDIHIGFDGANPSRGVLTIQNGGRLDSSRNGYIGYSAGANSADARVIVTDAGSVWNLTSGFLTVGQSYEGTLTIRDGGKVNSHQGILGSAPNGVGTVNIWRMGSEWNLTSDIVIGESGRGELTISDNGHVSSASGILGLNSTGEGSVIVAGVGTRFTAANTMSVGVRGIGELTVAYGGEVEIISGLGVVKLSDLAGSRGTLNIGGASGEAAVEAGKLNVPRVAFGNGEGTLVFNHSNAGYTFSADLDGYGTILHEAGETVYTGSGGLLSGQTRVSGGRLLVNGFLGGMTTVNGGVLGGSGDVVDLAINSGGTLAPGNSIGVIAANNATFNAGSVFEVELNDGGNAKGVNNDLLNATHGAGYLEINGGTIHVKPENGTDDGSTYTPGLIYTIIEAKDRSGEFDQVIDDFPLLTFTDIYSGANVYLQSAAVSTCPGGMTFNQTNTCGGVMSVGSGDMYNAVLNLTGSELPDALDQLSGEAHASVVGALIEDSRFPREAASDRVRSALRYDGASSVAPRVDYGVDLWARGVGSIANWNGDGNAAITGRSKGGVFLGADGSVTDTLRLGVLGGYSRASFNVDDRMSSGTVDTYTLGAYGGGEWGRLNLMGGVAHGWHGVDTSRTVRFTGFSDRLSASYSARTLQAWGEAAYRLDMGSARFEPFANLAYVNLSTDGFNEIGGPAALTGTSETFDATFTTLGLRAETDVALGVMAATLHGTVGWRHAVGDAPASQMQFASGGNAFTIAGVPLAQDTVVVAAGVDVSLSESTALEVSYGGLFGAGLQDQSARARLSVKF
ncbi:autotransporter domain-containing protein [Nitratireductor sp. GISD-1A_MAKvit]|uniref:autotransporter outer membrane beta-barrel domain-containing protein n=1 Tax=Nitratireductor sp. GISD-1A_MAKvit TaxID=3234198 RepID=UPI003467ACB9